MLALLLPRVRPRSASLTHRAPAPLPVNTVGRIRPGVGSTASTSLSHSCRAFSTNPACRASSVDAGSATSPKAGQSIQVPHLQCKSRAGKVVEFDPLARVRAALHKQVPKTFPEIKDERLRDLLSGKASKALDPVFRAAYHPEALEFIGDRIWAATLVQSLFLLAPRPTRRPVGAKLLVMGDLGPVCVPFPALWPYAALGNS